MKTNLTEEEIKKVNEIQMHNLELQLETTYLWGNRIETREDFNVLLAKIKKYLEIVEEIYDDANTLNMSIARRVWKKNSIKRRRSNNERTSKK